MRSTRLARITNPAEHDPYYEEGVADLNLNRLKLIGLGEPQPGYSLTPEKVRFAYLTAVFYSMLDSAGALPVCLWSGVDAVWSGGNRPNDPSGHRLGYYCG